MANFTDQIQVFKDGELKNAKAGDTVTQTMETVLQDLKSRSITNEASQNILVHQGDVANSVLVKLPATGGASKGFAVQDSGNSTLFGVATDGQVTATQSMEITGNVQIGGNLEITGSLVSASTEQLNFGDNIIALNWSEYASHDPGSAAGMVM